MSYKRPTVKEKPSAQKRKKLLSAYMEHYSKIALEDRAKLNQKIPRETFAHVLDEIGEMLIIQAEKMAKQDEVVREFLKDNSLPAELSEWLSDDFRTFCLILNALKQWVSAEQSATDRYFLTANVRKELRELADKCMVTGESLSRDDIDLHHPVRDGRPPIPLSKQGHAIIEGQKKRNDQHQ